MICSKGQLVRLTAAALHRVQHTAVKRDSAHEHTHVAVVLSFVYLDQPEGERGVQLDRDLSGSKWWPEDCLEAAPE